MVTFGATGATGGCPAVVVGTSAVVVPPFSRYVTLVTNVPSINDATIKVPTKRGVYEVLLEGGCSCGAIVFLIGMYVFYRLQ